MATTAWIVPVWTERLGGGHPMLVAYIAAFVDPADAKEAVIRQAGLLEGDEVKEPAAVSEATVTALKLAPGQVTML